MPSLRSDAASRSEEENTKMTSPSHTDESDQSSKRLRAAPRTCGPKSKAIALTAPAQQGPFEVPDSDSDSDSDAEETNRISKTSSATKASSSVGAIPSPSSATVQLVKQVKDFFERTGEAVGGKGGQYKWRCLISGCNREGRNTSGAKSHLETCHKHVKDVQVALAHYKGRNRKQVKAKAKAAAPLSSAPENGAARSSSPVQGSIRAFALSPSSETRESVCLAVAEFLIMCNLAFSLLANRYFLKLVAALIAYGRTNPPDLVFESRETFKKKYMEEGVFERERKAIANAHSGSMEFGATLVCDGRKTVNGTSLEVALVETPGGSFLLGSGSPSPGEVKNAAWYSGFFASCLTMASGPFERIASTIVAVTTDGARASVSAAGTLQEKEGTIAVLCQLHAVNRTVLHLFQRVECLAWLVRATKIWLSGFRDVGWVCEMLEDVAKCTVYRFVDTRMLLIPVVLARLCRLKDHVEQLIATVEFKKRVQSEKARVRKKIQAAIDVAKDPRFWELAKFGSSAFVHLTIFGREMDKGKLNISLVLPSWLSLVASVLDAIQEFDGLLTSSEKAALVDSLEKDFLKYTRPVFSAALFLTPCLREYVDDIKRNDFELFHSLRSATVAVLQDMVRRFDYKGDGAALAEPREAPADLLSQLQDQLDEYSARSGPWRGIDYKANLAPRVFWAIRAPVQQLAFYAARILSIVPAGSNTERAHKRFAGHHTKTRNRLQQSLVDELVRAKLSISTRHSPDIEECIGVGDRDVRPAAIAKYLEAFVDRFSKAAEDELVQDVQRIEAFAANDAVEEKAVESVKGGLAEEEEALVLANPAADKEELEGAEGADGAEEPVEDAEIHVLAHDTQRDGDVSSLDSDDDLEETVDVAFDGLTLPNEVSVHRRTRSGRATSLPSRLRGFVMS